MLAGEADKNVPTEKPTGNAASTPSVLQGYKKLDGTFRADLDLFRVAE
jgi:hypothetical protein